MMKTRITVAIMAIGTIDLDKQDELDGFSFLNTTETAIAVTSSRSNNVHFINVNW